MAVKFFLDFPEFQTKSKHSLQKRAFFIGSCFAQNMAEKFQSMGFDYLSNPFGVVFNPVSISKQISTIVHEKNISQDDLFEFDGLWNHWDSSHKFSDVDSDALVAKFDDQISKVKASLAQTDWVVITLGTSMVYRLTENGEVVANCHKAPQDWFQKTYLSSIEISEALNRISDDLKSLNPEINILWTISPVRYIRDGLTESIFSKSLLFGALQEQLIHAGNSYFPAYEILTDCLRDYRFYASDLVHPSSQSIDIISDYLTQNWLSTEDFSILKNIESYLKFSNHKAINENPKSTSKLNEQESDIKRLTKFWSPRIK